MSTLQLLAVGGLIGFLLGKLVTFDSVKKIIEFIREMKK